MKAKNYLISLIILILGNALPLGFIKYWEVITDTKASPLIYGIMMFLFFICSLALMIIYVEDVVKRKIG